MAQASFMNRVRSWFNITETQPLDPRRHLRTLPIPVQTAGITLTMDGAMQLSVVWACMDAITKGIAVSPWGIYVEDKTNRTKQYEDPLDHLLNTRPNPEMTAIAWREAMLYQTLSWGNGYSEIEFTNSGKVKSLWPLFSDRCIPRRLYNGDGSPGELVYDYYNFTGGWTTLPAWKVYHVRGPSLNGFMGENMVARAAKAIGLAVAAERFAASYFANGTVLGTVLKYPKTLTDVAHKRLKEDWEEKHQGPDRAHKPFILEGGMEIDSLGDDPAQAQLIETRKFSLEEICRFFGVPPHKVQHLERATFNNIEHLGLEFVRDALTPWAVRMEQEADYKLLPQKSPWRCTKLDMEWLSHGDAKSRADAYKVYREMGIYSANDILQREGRNTIGPEGDVRIVPLNMTTIEGVEQSVEKLKADIEKIKNPPPVAPGANPFGPKDPAAPPDGKPPAPEKTTPPPATKPPPPAKDALHAAISALVSGSLDRYRRRLQNRETDLRRNGKRTDADVRVKMAEEREDLRPRLVAELQAAAALLDPLNSCATNVPVADYLLTADAVDNGESVDTATSNLVNKMMEGA
jgi:HK97 family phage portal protein